MPDPGPDDILPADDAAWDEGVGWIPKSAAVANAKAKQILKAAASSTVSSPTVHQMSSFALLCQAARLLGQVLRYVSAGGHPANDPVHLQLDRTLHSMLAAALNVDFPDTDQIAFVYRHVKSHL